MARLTLHNGGAINNVQRPGGLIVPNRRPWFDLTDLFADGEAGFTFPSFDPREGALFQDSAGNTPANSAGDPVALVRDLSGNKADAIQDVNDAFRPTLQQDAGGWYLDFDGVDDYLYVPTLDMGGSSDVSIFAGVTKDVAAAGSDVVVEHSANYFNNNGTFRALAPASASEYNFVSKGTTSGTANTAQPLPDTAVVTCLGSNADNMAQIRINGTLEGDNSADQGTGPYLNYPLYIGARGGTTLFFFGRLYSLTVLARKATTTEITQAENTIGGLLP